jgi:hypothetical protein
MTRIVTTAHRYKRIPLMFCLLLAARALPANAQDKVIGGNGLESCDSWLDHRRQGGSSDMQWVLGYLSGVAGWSNFNPLRGTDAQGIWYWLDNFCSSHPDRPLVDGLDAFIRRAEG